MIISGKKRRKVGKIVFAVYDHTGMKSINASSNDSQSDYFPQEHEGRKFILDVTDKITKGVLKHFQSLFF